MYKIFRFIFLLNIISVLALVNCSYVMDSIEASITERSAFSIKGSFNPDTNEVAISWSGGKAGAGDEAFAGYEIYMTKQADNEFVGYTVKSAPYDLGEGVMTGADSNDNAQELTYTIVYDAQLRRYSTDSTTLSINSSFSGIQFFRVGVIHWSVDTKLKRAGEDDDDPDTHGWIGEGFVEYSDSSYDEYDDNQTFYVNRTNLSAISGGLMIEIE